MTAAAPEQIHCQADQRGGENQHAGGCPWGTHPCCCELAENWLCVKYGGSPRMSASQASHKAIPKKARVENSTSRPSSLWKSMPILSPKALWRRASKPRRVFKPSGLARIFVLTT